MVSPPAQWTVRPGRYRLRSARAGSEVRRAMHENPVDAPPTFYPYFGYRDAAAALQWLMRAFGFETVVQAAGPDGSIVHAEMRFGNGGIMLSSYTDEQLAANPQPPTGYRVYVYVDDVDAHCERAQAAGARIVFGPGAHGAIAVSILKATSGASETTYRRAAPPPRARSGHARPSLREERPKRPSGRTAGE